MKFTTLPLFLFLVITVALAGAGSITTAQTASSLVVDANANLRVPENYRTEYQYLGTWAVAADEAGEGSQGLHEVYASPGTIAAYRKVGDFPDGTVLVKEVYGTETESMTTGLVSRAQTLKGWFVMVRDSKNTHPGHKLWGGGWGWSWFDADSPTKTTSTDYTADCKPCHLAAEATHWIYVQGYPSLRR